MRERINNQIRAKELRIIGSENENLGVMSIKDALEYAQSKDMDLIEISPNANPPVGKIMNFGKYQYELSKKLKKAKANASSSETKSIQIKIELFLAGRAKYMDEKFLKERLDRILHLITEDYKISDPYKKGPKGLTTTIEKIK